MHVRIRAAKHILYYAMRDYKVLTSETNSKPRPETQLQFSSMLKRISHDPLAHSDHDIFYESFFFLIIKVQMCPLRRFIS